MKYLIIFFMIMGLNANENLETYKQEVNTLMNYTLKIPSKIYDVFIVPNLIHKKIANKKSLKKQQLKLEDDIKLLAILNNKVCLKIGNQVKWVKIGNKIGDYKIVKILNNYSVIILDNKKMKILSLDKKNNFKIKVR